MERTFLSLFAVGLLLLGAPWLAALAQERTVKKDQEDAESKVATITPQVNRHLKFKSGPYAIYFSKDGKQFAADDDVSTTVWDTGTWEQLGCFAHDNKLIHCVYLGLDGRRIGFSSTRDKVPVIFDLASGRVLRSFHERPSIVYAKFSPDGNELAVVSDNIGVTLWDVETGKDLKVFPAKLEGSGRAPLAFSPGGDTLAVAAGDGTVYLLSLQKGHDDRNFPPNNPAFKTPNVLTFSPDGRLLAVGLRLANTVTVWDVRAGKVVWQLQWPVSRDPEFLALGYKPELVRPDPKRPPGVSDLAFTADSRSLIIAGADRQLRVWEMSSGGLRYRIEALGTLLAVAPSGSLCAALATGNDRLAQVGIWDSRTGVPRLTSSTDLDKAWSDLDATDAGLAYQRMRELASNPKQALSLLNKRLQRVDSVKASVLERLVKDLDDDNFEVREQATHELAKLGDIAQPVLSRAIAMKPSAEAYRRIKDLLEALQGPLVGERLRVVRAMEVLEALDCTESRLILKQLAQGDSAALLTREAKASLSRLDAKK